ncbi:MAG TPA: exodeoxyribonuclease VII small subunit [Methanothrix sp.]|jgi:exodeoxyribonuclease VII small subunit|uniref:exodeoxyribonuclease VII small subunit n=1 Tax=Methanothrix sp. TaxID=90426 RepID=UPI002BF0F888|nr:exodeoxyribonuclease VII small subunit [Methanothrix sp.]MDI9416325.1 exodeoxyribonuclease VII small subunit [Euryarchaeota archaeon]HON34687.1 exodeoxyribonuclease VII small subunit [Methanothrix sp.]HRU75067.1 exodeoxyribonuclease VII small subunit [Methanothrix sp.]
MKEEEVGLEGALEELERIVEELEEGKLSLERSLELYERGMGLVRLCNLRLDSAQRRIECLTGEMPPDLL